MGLIIKAPPSQGAPTIFPMKQLPASSIRDPLIHQIEVT